MTVPHIHSLAAISGGYDAVLCDIWGVLHDGRTAFAPASQALVDFRRRGGKVALVTNAPRPQAPIREQILHLGVPPDAFDAIVTSGDVTIAAIVARGAAPVHHIGPERDLSLFAAAASASGAKPPMTALAEAEYIVCTGLFNESIETPEDYMPTLREAARRRLTMLCANPDLVVHIGPKLIYCAGAIAQAYEILGGETVYAGKPHAPIYARACALIGAPADPKRILAIGDAMRTDVAGASEQGFDALFVVDGIHREEWREHETADAFFNRHPHRPVATTDALRP